MGIKKKLLEAVGEVNVSEVGEVAMVDILVGRIKTLEAENTNLRSENAHELLTLHSEHERLNEERKRLRSDPFYGAYGEAYFLGNNGEKYKLSMQGGKIQELFMRTKKIDFLLQQISPAQFDAA